MKPHMATNDGATARLNGRFSPGTKVGLYRGHTDSVAPDPGLKAAFKTAIVGDNGIEFTGLDQDERLFIAGYVEEDVPRPGEREKRTTWRYVAIHAQVPRPARKPDSAKTIATALGSTLSPHELEPDRTTVGARGTRSLSRAGQPFALAQTGQPTPEGAPGERVPHLRQEDARDVEQRSATFTGQATPVDPSEQVPKPKQVEGVDLEQRSATPFGELTPIPAGEVRPAVPQTGDENLEQRVATGVGAQTPVPEGDPVEVQRRKESSSAKAEGAVVPPVVPRKKSQKRKPVTAKKGTATRKRPARTSTQKAARRKRDAAQKKSS